MKPLQYQLENGLKVILMPNHAAPVVACNVWVGVGSADETPEQAGLAHVHEHMLFKGTERRGVGEIAENVEAYGGQINAFTSFDFTCYYVVQSSRDFENAIDVLADAILHSTFDQEELTKELEVIQEEIKRGMDSPEQVVSQMLFTNAYDVHPYRLPVIGTKASVDSFKREDVIAFYKQHYLPSNCTVVLVGDFEIERAKVLINNHFGVFNGQPYQRPLRKNEPDQKALKIDVQSKEIADNHLEIGFHVPDIRHEDIAALKLLSTYLGVGESSLLYHVIHRQLGYASEIYASCYTPKDSGLFIVSANYQFDDFDSETVEGVGKIDESEGDELKEGGSLKGSPQQETDEDQGEGLLVGFDTETNDLPNLTLRRHEQLLTKIFEEIELLKKREISEDDLERSKILLESQDIYGKQTVQGYAMRLGLNEQLTGDPCFQTQFHRLIREVDVEDIQRVAEKYLCPERCTIALLRSDKSPEVTEGRIRECVEAVVNEYSSEGLEEETVPADGSYFSFHGEYGDVITCDLPNGIKLVVQEDHSVETYSAYMVGFGGTRYETEQTCGVGGLASDLITSGTRKRGSHEIANFMESKASFMDGVSGRNTFALHSVGLSRFFDEGFDCFSDCWQNYSLPEDEFQLKKGERLRLIKASEDRLGSLTYQRMASEFYRPHPYALPRVGLERAMKEMTVDRLRQEMYRFTRGEPVVLCVVGDVNADHVAEMAVEFFESRLMEEKALGVVAPEIARPSVRTEPVFVRNHLNKEQAYLTVGFSAPALGDRLRYTGNVLQAILNGQGGRLFLELRDRQSLAYSLHASVSTGVEASCFSISIGTSPEKVEQALEGIYVEVEKLRQGGIEEKELLRAKRYLSGNYDISLQRNGTRATSFALDELYGFGYQETLSYSERIEEVTMEQIDEFIETYFEPRVSVASITTPREVELSPELLFNVLQRTTA